jgi:hypothetical protein
MAICARRDYLDDQLVHHSDRGVQYTSIRYTQRLEDIGAVRSVGRKGSYDNAAAEAVNSLYKKGLINREGPWQDAGQVTVATAEWVFWYNDDRLHSACGNIPPVEYENARLTSPDRPIIIPEAKHRSLQRTRGGSNTSHRSCKRGRTGAPDSGRSTVRVGVPLVRRPVSRTGWAGER